LFQKEERDADQTKEGGVYEKLGTWISTRGGTTGQSCLFASLWLGTRKACSTRTKGITWEDKSIERNQKRDVDQVPWGVDGDTIMSRRWVRENIAKRKNEQQKTAVKLIFFGTSFVEEYAWGGEGEKGKKQRENVG